MIFLYSFQRFIRIVVLDLIMGGCLSLWHKPDLTGSTFSHYSLNSQSDNLDLYPGFR